MFLQYIPLNCLFRYYVFSIYPSELSISVLCAEKSRSAISEKSDDTTSSSSSDGDDENIKSITKEDSEKDYDSDKDPAWTPFEVVGLAGG